MSGKLLANVPKIGVLALSAAVGYVSLSQEILWMRLLAYATGGAPEVFGHVLGVFLVGIAFGSLLGRRVTQTALPIVAVMAGLLLAAAVIYFASVPLIALFREKNYTDMPGHMPQGMRIAYLFVGLVALLQGGILTMLCHVGIPKDADAGAAVAWVYVANIVGSTAGPLLTGFVLLEHMGVLRNIVVLSVAAALLAGAVMQASSLSTGRKLATWAFVLLFCGACVGLEARVGDRLLEQLQGWKRDRYAFWIENRSGIIAVQAQHDGDKIYGGGLYDGRFNVDPDRNSNGINRAYFMAALHPQPTNVLEIGLSSGSWSRVLCDYQDVKTLDIVEINAGYPEAIKRYPVNAAVLAHPKVTMHFDDGRRWLVRNPDRTFDFILMNTTFHWRSQITNLVSVEFLQLAKQHLKPGGVIYWNTTHSDAIPYTAAHVFKHVLKYANFVAASDSPFDISDADRAANLDAFSRDGKQVFGEGRGQRVRKGLMRYPLLDQGPALRAVNRPELLIRDDNMVTEYKHCSRCPKGVARLWSGKAPVLHPARTWSSALARIF